MSIWPQIYCLLLFHLSADILYDSWSPAMTVSSVCISILSMLSSSPAKVIGLHCVLSCLNGDHASDHIICLLYVGCSNVLPTMIAMSGTAAMGGRRRRPGGGFMMTKCDWFQLPVGFSSATLLPATLPLHGVLHGRWFRHIFKWSIWPQINMRLWFVNECEPVSNPRLINYYTLDIYRIITCVSCLLPKIEASNAVKTLVFWVFRYVP